MSAKGAAMSPTTNEIHLPTGMTIERRAQCFSGTDERPLLRDRDGHVLAEVEQWQPESMTGFTPRN
jgi:predicted pyridoxine 5'-phosphate oxidase superfamily flavin-nucleotide-binding protein